MIAVFLVGEVEAVVACWDDSTRSAWITDPTTPKVSPPLGQFGEKRHCVADLRPMLPSEMQRLLYAAESAWSGADPKPMPALEMPPLDDAECFAVALREYALAHALRPTWFGNAVVLIRSDRALTVSLVKVDYGCGVKRLPPPVRSTVEFLMEFFAGIPQTTQDRLIYRRLPDFGIPF